MEAEGRARGTVCTFWGTLSFAPQTGWLRETPVALGSPFYTQGHQGISWGHMTGPKTHSQSWSLSGGESF